MRICKGKKIIFAAFTKIVSCLFVYNAQKSAAKKQKFVALLLYNFIIIKYNADIEESKAPAGRKGPEKEQPKPGGAVEYHKNYA